MKSLLFTLIALFSAPYLNAQWAPVFPVNFHIQQGTVHAISPDTVVIAGDNGRVYFSDDGAQNFTKDSLPFPYSWFTTIDFPSKSVGYVSGGTAFGPVQSPLAKTTDGGVTWDSISGNQFGYQITDLSFVNNDTGYLLAGDVLAKTVDGGNSFARDTLPFGWMTQVHFVNANLGFIMAYRHIHRTVDGGLSWDTVFIDTNVNIFPVGGIKLEFVSAQVGFALLQGGDVVRTVDGGQSWHYTQLPGDTLRFSQVNFVNANTGYALTNRPRSGGFSGHIYKTTNSGQNWQLQHIDTTQSFLTIHMANAQVGYVLGSNTLLATTNGGLHQREWASETDFEIYPNPATTEVTLKMPDEVQMEELRLLNSVGKPISAIPMEKDNTHTRVNVAHLPSGLYYVEVKLAGGISLHRKLIINR